MAADDHPGSRARPYGPRIVAVGASALRLGLTSFGGPVAYIGYFRRVLWTSTVHTAADLAILGAAVALLVIVGSPPVLVVLFAAAVGLVFGG